MTDLHDATSVQDMVLRERKYILGVCKQRLRRYRNPAIEPEDLAQMVMIRAWRGAATYRAGASLRSWLYQIAVNLTIDMHRRKRSDPLRDTAELSDGILGGYHSDPLEVLECQEILAALDNLPKNYGALLLMSAHGFALDEIAAFTNLRMGTVKSRTHRAREMMRAAFRKNGHSVKEEIMLPSTAGERDKRRIPPGTKILVITAEPADDQTRGKFAKFCEFRIRSEIRAPGDIPEGMLTALYEDNQMDPTQRAAFRRMLQDAGLQNIRSFPHANLTVELRTWAVELDVDMPRPEEDTPVPPPPPKDPKALAPTMTSRRFIQTFGDINAVSPSTEAKRLEALSGSQFKSTTLYQSIVTMRPRGIPRAKPLLTATDRPGPGPVVTESALTTRIILEVKNMEQESRERAGRLMDAMRGLMTENERLRKSITALNQDNDALNRKCTVLQDEVVAMKKAKAAAVKALESLK